MASSARIEELRKKFEENPRRYFAPLANEYRKAGDIEQAIAICREYLPQQPGHMSGHIVYGQALFEAKQAEEAKTVFETALALDPENLIALRHLGDIALLVGDSEAARMWYGRVLEADPRNEEIQAQLAALDTGAPSVAPPSAAAAPAPPSPPGEAAPTLEVPVTSAAAQHPVTATSPTLEIHAMKPAEPAQATATSPTAEIVLDALPAVPPSAPSGAAPDLGFEPTQQRFSIPINTARLDLDAPVSAPKESAPVGGGFLEGLETTSMSAPPAAPPAAEPSAPTVDLDFGAPAAPTPTAPPAVDLDFGLPPEAPASASEAPLTVDLDFGAPAAPIPPARPAVASADDGPLLDIGELPSAPVPTAASFEPAPAAAPEASDDAPGAVAPDLAAPEPRVDAPPGEVPEAELVEAPTAAPDSGPFVTETMAELYLKQGHRDEALRVYRALLDQRPDDSVLHAKVKALSEPPPAVPVYSGPTIRELLYAIASRRPGVRGVTANGNGAVTTQAGTTDALAALFGDAPIAPADEHAAVALGHAFADLSGMEQGAAPARATMEPALEAVLAPAHTPQQSAAPTFSFDQFFSPRATSEHEAQPATPSARPQEAGDDVAQFNQWLQGLKQQ